MKKVLLLASTVAISLTSAQAAQLLSGWDMSNLDTQANQFVAGNYSDITADGLANSNGTIYWDSTNGSDSIPFTIGGGSSNNNSTLLTQNTTITTRTLNNQIATSPTRGLGFSNSFQADASNQAFVVEADVTEAFDTIILSFAAALNAAGSIDISWEYDNGSGFESAGVTTTTTSTTGEQHIVALDSNLAFGSSVLLRGTLGTIASNRQITIDNVQVTGEVVPEPSTYAMIAGVAVLGLAYMRRRRS